MEYHHFSYEKTYRIKDATVYKDDSWAESISKGPSRDPMMIERIPDLFQEVVSACEATLPL
jgi:hypothetical protein